MNQNRKQQSMGWSGRKSILIGLVFFMVLGFGVYFMLWSIDSDFSSEERDLIRRQFDLANKEAMDETAEWRIRYDEEVERSAKCVKELSQVKEVLGEKEGAASINMKLTMLQKENIDLHNQIETLKQELETEKLKCHSK